MMVPDDFKTFPTPTMSTTSTSVAPIPTVIPGVPLLQNMGDTGERTLW